MSEDRREDQKQQDQGQDQKPNPIQQRIAQLYGQKKQAEEEAALYKQQLQELQAQLQAVRDELLELKSGAAVSSSPTPSFEGLGGFNANPAPASPPPKELVKEAVQEVVGPLLSEWQKAKQVQELRLKQREAFTRACTQFPELADPNSDLFQATDEVLRRNPKLQEDPDGPFTAALIAQGILARAGGQGGNENASVQQKIAASPPPPSTGPSGEKGPRGKLEELEQQYEQVLQQLRQTTDEAEIERLWGVRNELATQLSALKAQLGQ